MSEEKEFNVAPVKEQIVVITTDAPPEHIYKRAQELFGDRVNFEKGTVFTYGYTIHIFDKSKMNVPLYHHETKHCFQQAKYESPDAWWERYFTDVEFRKQQEFEAYERQIKSIKKHIKDRNRQVIYIHYIQKDFASSMYGNMVTLEESRRLLK